MDTAFATERTHQVFADTSRIRSVLESRIVEYSLLVVLAATAAYTTMYAWGTHNDVQHSLRCINAALGLA